MNDERLRERNRRAATHERDTINRVLWARGLKTKEGAELARVVRAKVTPVSYLFQIGIAPTVDVGRVTSTADNLALSLSELRGEAVRVRLTHPPLIVEVPARYPRAITWPRDLPFDPGHMAAGDAYGINGKDLQRVNLDQSPHTLIAGITGSGKSVLAQGLALSLALGEGPDLLRFALVDMKNDDFLPLRTLPHAATFAGDPDRAMEVITGAHALMEARRDSVTPAPFRLVLWIDELAQVPADGLEIISDLLALGRSMKINVIAATQHPTAEIMGGGASKVNYTTRLVGLVSDASAAATATGRKGTGAEFLPGRGSFVRVEREKLTRFQAFNIDPDAIPGIVADVHRKWDGVDQTPVPEIQGHRRPIAATGGPAATSAHETVTTPQGGPARHHTATIETAPAAVTVDPLIGVIEADRDDVIRLVPFFAESWDAARGKWRHGTKGKIAAALYGDDWNSSGSKKGRTLARLDELGIVLEQMAPEARGLLIEKSGTFAGTFEKSGPVPTGSGQNESFPAKVRTFEEADGGAPSVYH